MTRDQLALLIRQFEELDHGAVAGVWDSAFTNLTAAQPKEKPSYPVVLINHHEEITPAKQNNAWLKVHGFGAWKAPQITC